MENNRRKPHIPDILKNKPREYINTFEGRISIDLHPNKVSDAIEYQESDLRGTLWGILQAYDFRTSITVNHHITSDQKKHTIRYLLSHIPILINKGGGMMTVHEEDVGQDK
jgi:hypothetical protein